MLIEKEVNLSLKRFRNLTLIIFAYSILGIVEFKFEINLPLLRYFVVLIGSFFILNLISIPESFKSRFKGSVKLLVFLILFFILYSILLGLPELLEQNRNYINLKRFIGEKALLFMLPLLLFIRPNAEHWRYLIKYAYIMLLILVPFLLLDIVPFLTREKSPEGLIRATAGSAGFFLLLGPYFSPFKRSLITSIYLISLLFMLYHARRNMVLYFSFFFFFYVYLNFFSSTIILGINRLKSFGKIVFFVFFAFVLLVVLKPDFSLFTERISTGLESREEITEDFFFDIPIESQDFFQGRGMLGTFYSTSLGFDKWGDIGTNGGERGNIENGYLQIILNFGFVYLFAFVLLSLIAFTKGFYRSKNILAKSCAVLILINLIDMIGFGVPEITFRYFLVWFSIVFCFDKSFRNYSDFEVKNLIFLK